MTVLLGGVDAGATRCEAVVAGPTLDIRARRVGPAGAISPGDTERAASIFAQVLDGAMADGGLSGPVAALVVGAAGAGREADRAALESSLKSRLGRSTRVGVTTDVAVALEDAFPDDAPGIVVIAGSGSVATARDQDGGTWRTGGLGWQLGDEGSGYALGRAALGAVGRAADGRGARTELSARIGTRTQTESLEQLVRWAQTADRRSVAALATDVCAAAVAGDDVANELVDEAAAALVLHVEALLRHFPASTRVTVALAGGLLTPGSAIRTATVTAMCRRLPQTDMSGTQVDPARGALRLAARLLA